VADESGTAETGFSESATAKPKTPRRSPRAAPKTATADAAPKDEETGDGA
jgi:hypothetical protein